MKRCKGCKLFLSLEFYTKQEGYPIAYCKKCRNSRSVLYQRKRRLERKLRAIDYKGGKCKKCGYKKNPYALDFNHINPKEKSGEVGKIIAKRSWDIAVRELDKCELLCANCHREITSQSYPQSTV